MCEVTLNDAGPPIQRAEKAGESTTSAKSRHQGILFKALRSLDYVVNRCHKSYVLYVNSVAISKEFALQFPNVSFGTHRVSCLSTAACNRTQEKYGKAPYVQEFEGFGANANLHPGLTDLKKLRDHHIERLNS